MSSLAVLTASLGTSAEGPIPAGMPHLDRIFVIMMENHGYIQVVGNPSLPYTNALMGNANIATNYFAVALSCMPVSDVQQSAGREYREINGNA